MSVSMLCRICVNEVNEFVYLLDLYYGDVAASLFIEDILKIDISNNHQGNHSPLIICETCNNTLKHFQLFYQTVKQAQRKYQQINVKLENDSKTEDILDSNEKKLKIEHFNCSSEDEIDSDSQPLALFDKSKKQIKSKVRKIVDDGRLSKRKNVPRSQKATEAVLKKYKLEDIYSEGKWNISLEEKDDLFSLFIDMKCKECSQTFTNYRNLVDHCTEKHGLHPIVTCDSFSLASYELMERHILYKHLLNTKMPRLPRARVPCHVCNKLVRDCSMREHLSSHLPHDKREFQCDRCHAGFGTKGALRSHIALNHEATEVSCSECSKPFRNIYHMTQHKRRVHGTSDRNHLCPECGKEYKDLITFSNHVKQHYGIVDRVKCSICEAVIKRACLSSHMRAHDVSNQKQCPHCPYKGFRIREHIKRAHEKVKTRSCALCPKQFYNLKGLKDHMASSHTGIPEYSCEFCGATFMNSGNCHSHRKKMHPTNWAMQKMEKAKSLNTGDIPVCDPTTLLRNKHILEGEQAQRVIQDLQNRRKKSQKE